MLIVLNADESHAVTFVLLSYLPTRSRQAALGGHVETSVSIEVLGEQVDIARVDEIANEINETGCASYVKSILLKLVHVVQVVDRVVLLQVIKEDP